MSSKHELMTKLFHNPLQSQDESNEPNYATIRKRCATVNNF
jgi:hypothetical protein